MIFNTTEVICIGIIYGCCAIGGIFAVWQWCLVSAIDIEKEGAEDGKNYVMPGSEAQDDEQRALMQAEEQQNVDENKAAEERVKEEQKKAQFAALLKMIKDYGGKIDAGATTFLVAEYKIMAVFIVLFGALVYGIVDVLGARASQGNRYVPYATISFIIGAVTSILCGYIGMKTAVNANYRTTFKAMNSNQNEAYADAFVTAYRAGCVMGFGLVSISLSMLLTIIIIYAYCYEPSSSELGTRPWEILMDLIAGYGLGGSSMALFGRVGGGIYTKAADVGADLAGKLDNGLEEDDPRNPAVVADNVGDNVGDIAGMGSDLFGSLAESTCASLVLITANKSLFNTENAYVLFYPLMISAVGIIACLLTVQFAFYIYKVTERERIQKSLNYQLLISTILMLFGVWGVTPFLLPATWEQNANQEVQNAYWYYPGICVTFGLVAGFLIGVSTDYYTSNSYNPVREMAMKCWEGGPAINVIYGLAVGYASCIIPIFLLAFTVITCVCIMGMLGVALAAIGMLSTLAVGLAIDSYGPISDNAGGIAELSKCDPAVREVTDALDAAGNTTAAVGKGFAIGSAALVSLSLYGAFVTRAKQAPHNKLGVIEVVDGWVFGSMLIGAMLPYWFSSMTMKSVGKAAADMVREVQEQLDSGKEPDSNKCIKISTNASLKEMIAPALLVMLTPIICGVLFGTRVVAGILPGALLSGIQLAISMSNTGGAWDNTKKYIESKQLKIKKTTRTDGEQVVQSETIVQKNSPAHIAAVIGDTIGDPLKDTSGPSLNILIKLMAIISLVFANGFSETSLLLKP